MKKVVPKTRETVRARFMLYKAVLQYVLLYGSDSWVIMGDVLKFLNDSIIG